MCVCKNKAKGFTLVELLVVISIIALLVSILMPALGKAREQAMSVKCKAHLKGLGVALLAHAGDNNHSMIPIIDNEDIWIHTLSRYIEAEDAFLCPKAETQGLQDFQQDLNSQYSKFGSVINSWANVKTNPQSNISQQSSNQNDEKVYTSSFGLNGWTQSFSGESQVWNSGDPMFRGKLWGGSVDSVGGLPTEIPMAMDCVYREAFVDIGDLNDPADQVWKETYDYTTNDALGHINRIAMQRHSDGVNMVFLDGHVDNVKLPNLWELRWHKDYKLVYDVTIDWYE